MQNQQALATIAPATDEEILKAVFTQIMGIEGDPKDLVAKYQSEKLPTLIIKDSSDTEGLKRVKEAYKLAVTTRTTIEKQTTELNRPHIDRQKQNNDLKKELLALVAPIETALKERLDAHENALRLIEEAKEKARLEAIEARKKRLYEAGGVFSGTLYVCGNAYLTEEQVERTDDNYFDNAVSLFAAEKQRIESEQKAASDKAAADAKELEELRAQVAKQQAVVETPATQPSVTNDEPAVYVAPAPEPVPTPEYKVAVVASSVSDADFVRGSLEQIVMECKLANGTDPAYFYLLLGKIQGIAEKAAQKV